MADLADPMLDHREAIRWAIATAALDARNALERVRRAALVAGVCGVDEAL
ncbi:MAG: hypothetical protein JWM85_1228, partial [Acidimicrobiaceae bacterium]|nr:hypothetical protein [Acidimicrobiaceae bacterium]